MTGGALAAIAAAATVAVPGLGLLVAGPIAAALAGAGAGAVVGGGIGALVGAGIPEERVKEYESGLKEGGILMGVTPRPRRIGRTSTRNGASIEPARPLSGASDHAGCIGGSLGFGNSVLCGAGPRAEAGDEAEFVCDRGGG